MTCLGLTGLLDLDGISSGSGAIKSSDELVETSIPAPS